MIRVLESAGSTLVEWGRQQQQQGIIGEKALRIYADLLMETPNTSA